MSHVQQVETRKRGRQGKRKRYVDPPGTGEQQMVLHVIPIEVEAGDRSARGAINVKFVLRCQPGQGWEKFVVVSRDTAYLAVCPQGKATESHG